MSLQIVNFAVTLMLAISVALNNSLAHALHKLGAEIRELAKAQQKTIEIHFVEGDISSAQEPDKRRAN